MVNKKWRKKLGSVTGQVTDLHINKLMIGKSTTMIGFITVKCDHGYKEFELNHRQALVYQNMLHEGDVIEVKYEFRRLRRNNKVVRVVRRIARKGAKRNAA